MLKNFMVAPSFSPLGFEFFPIYNLRRDFTNIRIDKTMGTSKRPEYSSKNCCQTFAACRLRAFASILAGPGDINRAGRKNLASTKRPNRKPVRTFPFYRPRFILAATREQKQIRIAMNARPYVFKVGMPQARVRISNLGVGVDASDGTAYFRKRKKSPVSLP